MWLGMVLVVTHAKHQLMSSVWDLLVFVLELYGRKSVMLGRDSCVAFLICNRVGNTADMTVLYTDELKLF